MALQMAKQDEPLLVRVLHRYTISHLLVLKKGDGFLSIVPLTLIPILICGEMSELLLTGHVPCGDSLLLDMDAL